MDSEAPCAKCNICGGIEFVRGPSQRLAATGRLPCCATCHSLERHRVARRVFDRLRPEYTEGKRCLQFSPDPGADKSWFRELSVSVWGGENSLDMQAIDLPDGRYDWIYSSHVLNHIPDQSAALKEMLRVVGDYGIVVLNVGGTAFSYGPAPSTRSCGPDRQFRTYGTEFADDLQQMLPDVAVLELVATDPCTATLDSVYLYSRNEDALRGIAQRAVPGNIHARLFRARSRVGVVEPIQAAASATLASAAHAEAATPAPEPAILPHAPATEPSAEPAVAEPVPSSQPVPLTPAAAAAASAGTLRCNVCGGSQFGLGPRNRRSSNGRAPRCICCGALERNRVMRRVFDAVVAGRTQGERLLQFTADPGVPESWFREVRISAQGGKNELDPKSTGLPEGRYDWLCAYHLVSDGPSDGSVLRELLRVSGPHGVVALSLAGSASKYEAVSALGSQADLPSKSSGFVEDAQLKIPELGVLELVTSDPCTATIDAVYLCSRNSRALEQMLDLSKDSGVFARLFRAPKPLLTAPKTETPAPSSSRPIASSERSASDLGWGQLQAEIKAWRGSGHRARFWVRDDDAITYTPELAQLLELCSEEQIPIALAVIPERAAQDLKDAITNRSGVTVLQHGFDHKNRGGPRDKSEFPDTRPYEEAMTSVRAGWKRLVDRFGDQALPVFVPPWGTCSLAVRRRLPETGLSGFSPSPVGPFRPNELCRRGSTQSSVGLSLVGTHLAVNRAVATDKSPLPIGRHLTFLASLVNAIRSDDSDPEEPIGIMTHAWGVDAFVRDFLRELFRATRDAGAEWANARELF